MFNSKQVKFADFWKILLVLRNFHHVNFIFKFQEYFSRISREKVHRIKQNLNPETPRKILVYKSDCLRRALF